MRLRITGAPRKIGERERFLAALNRGDRRQHRRLVAPDIIGQATLARAPPRRARDGAVGQQPDIRPQWLPGPATRTALTPAWPHPDTKAPHTVTMPPQPHCHALHVAPHTQPPC